jgi:carbamoyltransferase
MKIIGLNHGEIDSSAALVVGGKVVAACSEERFNRQKKSRAFPQQALQFCLRTGRLELPGCDAVAQAWNPGESWLKYNPLISTHRVRREDNFYAIPDHLFSFSGRRPLDWSAMDFPTGAGVPRIYHVTHHRAHAANAFFLSPFEEAAILTCDWRGEFESTTWCVGRGNGITVLDRLSVPHSLGMFYATFTELLGYRPDNDEWKVMALSAFDVDCRRAYRKLKDTYALLDNGRFELDQSYYKGALLDQPRLYTKKLQDLLGGRCGQPGDDITEWHCVVARAMQQAAEDIATHALRHLHKATKLRNLAVSGGFFMNSVFNGKVLDNTPFQRFYVSYAPGDLGNSIGAALYAAHCIHHERRRESPRLSYLGPEYSAADIEQCLNRRRLRYERRPSMERDIAGLVAGGHIVAVFQGRMEFGERALGNRSILAARTSRTASTPASSTGRATAPSRRRCCSRRPTTTSTSPRGSTRLTWNGWCRSVPGSARPCRRSRTWTARVASTRCARRTTPATIASSISSGSSPASRSCSTPRSTSTANPSWRRPTMP